MPELCGGTSAERKQRNTVRLARLAGSQHGVVSASQLASCGVSPAAITRWTAAGRLHRVHPSVYALGHRTLSLQGRLRAALLYAGSNAVLSHTTAAWVWEILEAPPSRLHLTVSSQRRSLPGIRLHRTRFMDATRHRGLPVTRLARTLRDIASMLPGSQLRRAIAEADYRGLLNEHEAHKVLGRGRRGAAALREALASYLPELARTRSVLEERFLDLCQDAALPLPAVNVWVDGMLVDALWRDQQIVVELDGLPAHASRAAMERDRGRELSLRGAGYRILRYTWHQITAEPDRVIADLRVAMSERAPPP
jgi:predicted transcriptional regulator of viral defense system